MENADNNENIIKKIEDDGTKNSFINFLCTNCFML